MAATAPAETLGKYELVRPLAQGGMAQIFLARQSGPGGFEKQVVIKRVLPHLATNHDFVQMFLDEARLAARLSHPNIVQVFDFGEADGSYFLAMEYLVGEDLATVQEALVSKRQGMPGIIAALILSSACEALHYAHTFADETGAELKIVHRDVSPSNLFLTYQGQVKVLDFGIAKAEGKLVHTESGVLKGKFLYMSPELITGEALDARSDVFALGAVLHEWLTGRPVFKRATSLASLRAITDERIPAPSELVLGVPPELEQIAMRALERDRGKRWQSALEMRMALDEYVARSSSAPPMGQMQVFLKDVMGEQRVQEKLRLPTSSSESGRSPSDGASATLRRATPESQRALRPAEAQEPDPSSAETLKEGSSAVVDLEAAFARKPRWKLAAAGGAALAVAAAIYLAVARAGSTPRDLEAIPIPEPDKTLAVDPRLTASSAPEPTPRPAPPKPSPAEARSERAPKPAPARPAAADPRVSKALKPAAEPPPAPATGMLNINCIPWCNVHIDGKDVNLTTPVKGYVLPAGTHHLKLVNSQTGLPFEEDVRIRAGESSKVVHRF
jgi:serine/threonine protein kinase